jgi:maltooligosyltrehalose synthase
MTPRATARLQLHAGFTFDDARAVLDHYATLGISHLYLSPITAARPGSLHGYDVIDPGHVNAELGGEPGFRRLAREAADRHMGLIVDIVPNHMAADPLNPWWADVLQTGPDSRHAHCFDVDWEAGRGKILLPIRRAPTTKRLRQATSGWCVHRAVPMSRQADGTCPCGARTGSKQRTSIPQDASAGSGCMRCSVHSITAWRTGAPPTRH